MRSAPKIDRKMKFAPNEANKIRQGLQDRCKDTSEVKMMLSGEGFKNKRIFYTSKPDVRKLEV